MDTRGFLERAAGVAAILAADASAPAPRLAARVGAAPALADGDPDELLTQRQAAGFLKVSISYLRASDCPKVLLPGRGRRPLVRYRRSDLVAWAARWTTPALGAGAPAIEVGAPAIEVGTPALHPAA